MKKSKAQKDILYIAISSFVLVALWIGFNLYHAHATSTIEPDLQIQTLPIDPVFDTEVINRLKNRENVPAVYELENVSSETTPSPTPPAVQPASSGSGALNNPAGQIEILGE